MLNKQTNKQAQETEVRIIKKYIRDYYKHTKYIIYLSEGSTALLSLSPLVGFLTGL